MDIKKLTVANIEDMSYTDFVSLIREENRPPGGKMTVREILKNSFVNFRSKVLEVGCTNGFTSLEVARTVGCEVFGIDINENSLENARNRIKEERVTFLKGSTYDLPFDDSSFDLVVCGNATSFMEEKNNAVQEYMRVVRDWGFVALTPMYYIKKPSIEIVDKVSDIIGTKIDITTKDEWTTLLEKNGFEIYYSKDYKFNGKNENDIKEYVELFLGKSFLRDLNEEIRDVIRKKWSGIMNVFEENLSYVGYSIILLRKRSEAEEKELFDVDVENEII